MVSQEWEGAFSQSAGMNWGWKLMGSQTSGTRTHGFPEELGRGHADYGAAGAVDFEHLADGRGTAPELAIPEGVADHDDGRGGGAVVGFGEDAAGAGGDAEDAESNCR